MRRVVLLVALSACGFKHGAFVGDAGENVIEDAPIDTAVIDGPAPTSCIQKWLDGTVQLGSLDEKDDIDTTSTERDPFLSVDEKTIFFFSDRTGNVNGDVYTATRSSTSATFGTVSKFTAANTSAAESKMSMTDDGLYFVVASTLNGTTGSVDILDATRASAADNFSQLGRTYTTLDCTGADELDPFVTGNGLELYIAQTINGFQRIVRATRATRTVPFSAATLVTELDSGAGDADPTVSSDGRIIIFSSNRPGAGGSSNLWYATRSSNRGPFGTPKPVPGANSDNADGDPWLSQDGCRLYFSSTRDNDYDLWSATVQ